MKKFWLYAAAILGIVSFVGCSDDPATTTPEPENPVPPVEETLTFEIDVEGTTYSTATFNITPSNLEAGYVVAAMPMEFYAEFTSGEEIIVEVLDQIKDAGEAIGKTFEEYLPTVLEHGAMKDAQVGNLVPGTDYMLVVFGVKDLAGASEVFTAEFLTQTVEPSDCTFEVEPMVTFTQVDFSVTVSDPEMRYHFLTMQQAEYDYYTDPEGMYQFDEKTFFVEYLAGEVSTLLNGGYSVEEAYQLLFFQGNLTLTAKNLIANELYIYMVAGFRLEGENYYICTDLTKGNYTSGDIQAVDMTFDISVTDIETLKAAIKITPSNLEEPFCWLVSRYDGVSTAVEVMNKIVEENKSWLDGGWMTYTGVQDYTGGPGSPYKFSLDYFDTDHYAIAFGYRGGITTAPEMVTFRTLPGGDPADCTFEFRAYDITPYDLYFELIPSDMTVRYELMMVEIDQFMGEELEIASYEEYIISSYEEMSAMYEEYGMEYSWEDHIQYNTSSEEMGWRLYELDPDTTYKFFAMVVNPEDGKVVNFFEWDPVSTLALGSVNPSVEVVGIYNGDEEAGQCFGDAATTAGRAILVAKYSDFEGATELYGASMAQLYDDMSDTQIMNSAYWNWNLVTMNGDDTYMFFVTTAWEGWGYDYSFLTYAKDANGVAGAIGQAQMSVTAENKDDIQNLIDLVNRLNEEETRSFSLQPIQAVDKAIEGQPATKMLRKPNTTPMNLNAIPEHIARPENQKFEMQGPCVKVNHLSRFRIL